MVSAISAYSMARSIHLGLAQISPLISIIPPDDPAPAEAHADDVAVVVLVVDRRDLPVDPSSDSPHLRHVSAPLARAGISILYQSSYFTDFLLVKASDFDKASLIFAEQGCEWCTWRC